MVSQFFLKNVGASFLLLSCLTSVMLIGLYRNEKYSVVVLAPREKHGKTKHEVDVFARKESRRKSLVKCHCPVEKAFWDPTKENILHIILKDGTERTVNVEVVTKMHIEAGR